MRLRVKSLREKRNWTQTDLAERAGISQNAVSQLESGQRKPMFETLDKVANALDTTVDYLKYGTPPTTNILTLARPIPPELQEEYEEVERKFNERASRDPLFLPRVLRIIQSGILDTESGVEAFESLVRALRPEPESKGADQGQNEEKQG